MTSLETISSSVYPSVTLAAFLNASLISSFVTSSSKTQVSSTIEPVTTGTLCAVPSSLPFNSGITSPIALAAPVEFGTILEAAALALLKSPFLCGESSVF